MEAQDPSSTDFVNIISKFNALENMILIRDQTITGNAKIIHEV